MSRSYFSHVKNKILFSCVCTIRHFHLYIMHPCSHSHLNDCFSSFMLLLLPLVYFFFFLCQPFEIKCKVAHHLNSIWKCPTIYMFNMLSLLNRSFSCTIYFFYQNYCVTPIYNSNVKSCMHPHSHTHSYTL